jgi:protoporphyrinogen/coproporphyrinogen III oxidase
MRIAIIGGGIAGLSAAYELEKARAAGQPVSYTLYEHRERLGGSLASETVDGSVLEQGPDSFISEKTAAADLARELGLGDQLLASNDEARKTFIVVGNRLIPLPDGLMFLVPTKLIPTALTQLFSLGTKLRMGLELLRPPRAAAGDESVAELVRRHFGQEAVDRLADPLLSGIYGGDATRLSAQTVLPGMVKMEAEYGSLCRGMLAGHRKMQAMKSAGSSKGNRPKRALFTAMRGGMQQLVDALAARIDEISVRRSSPVSALEKITEGWRVTSMGQSAVYDAVIIATPAWVASELLKPVDEPLANELGAIPYSSSITVNLVYDEKKLGRLPEGFGFLVPAVEGRSLLACTFVHRKFLGRTAPGKAIMRAFLGGMRNESMLTETDAVLVATVRRELGEILGPVAFDATLEPIYAQVTRWRRAMAQYAVGHKQRTAKIAEHVAALETLRLIGNAYDGIGVPDCIRLGRKAAQELIAVRETVGQGTRD